MYYYYPLYFTVGLSDSLRGGGGGERGAVTDYVKILPRCFMFV